MNLINRGGDDSLWKGPPNGKGFSRQLPEGRSWHPPDDTFTCTVYHLIANFCQVSKFPAWLAPVSQGLLSFSTSNQLKHLKEAPWITTAKGQASSLALLAICVPVFDDVVQPQVRAHKPCDHLVQTIRVGQGPTHAGGHEEVDSVDAH